MSRPNSRVRALLVVVLFLVGMTTANAQTKQSMTYKIGAWIQDLYDIQVTQGTFAGTVWLWANGSDGDRQPLKTLSAANMTGPEEQPFLAQERRGDRFWSEPRIHGKFRYQWNLRNFPFDRQKLEMDFVEDIDDTYAMNDVLDTRSSGISNRLVLQDWTVVGFSVHNEPSIYNTAFGDPSVSFDDRTARPAIQVSVELVRSSFNVFFKLTAIMYLCFFLTLITYFMRPADASPRGSFIGGALFATALNMRTVDSLLGTTNVLTLMDQLHIATLVAIFIAAGMLVLTRFMLDHHYSEALVARANRGALWFSLITFIALNAGSIFAAQRAG
jgi:hypothetical protein